MSLSGCSQVILDLLAKSVAKVNSKGKKGEKQNKTGKTGEEPSKIEDSGNRDPSRKAMNVESKDNWKKPKGTAIYQLKEDIIKSVVYNHLKKVAPKLAMEFEYKFTIVESSLKLESVINFSYKKCVKLIKEYEDENKNFEVSKTLSVLNMKTASPPCRPTGEASSLVSFPEGGDTGTWEEQEKAGGELEEEQGKHGGGASGGKGVMQGKLGHSSEYKQGKGGHICNFCKKSFRHPSKLKQHNQVHTGEKLHSCNICAKSFSLAGDLKRHKLTHSGVKSFSCDECPKSFTLSGHLKRHKRSHSGEKPFICDICPKAFSQADDLKGHKLKHRGEKPHMCGICNKGFTRPHKLKVHMLKHKETPEQSKRLDRLI